MGVHGAGDSATALSFASGTDGYRMSRVASAPAGRSLTFPIARHPRDPQPLLLDGQTICLDTRTEECPNFPTVSSRCSRRLADLFAVPTNELLAHVLNHFPLPRRDLQRLGHILAELGEHARAAGCACCRTWHDHPLARQMRRERLRAGILRVKARTCVVSSVAAAAFSAASSSSVRCGF